MAVVEHAHHTCCCGDTVAGHRPPGRAGESVLLVQQRGTHEGRSGVSRRPRVGGTSVRAHLLGGILDDIDETCHDGIRHTGAGQQAGPVATALIAAQLQTDHHCGAEELGIVVDTCFEVGQQLGILLATLFCLLIHAEHGLVTLQRPTGSEQRDAHEGHIVQEFVGLDSRIGLRLEEVEVHLRTRCRSHALKSVGRLLGQVYQFCLHLWYIECQRFHVLIVVGAGLYRQGDSYQCENVSNLHFFVILSCMFYCSVLSISQPHHGHSYS